MELSLLQTKEIIDIDDGRRIGNIIDANIEPTTGKIKSLVISVRRSRRVFNKEESIIKWEQIIKIGEDTILVNTKRIIN